MFETTLRITFISDWHIGSGLGDGAIADAVLNRDINGLPFIPGSAVKGALRESAWRLALCDPDSLQPLVDCLFGTASQEAVTNSPGRLFLGQALLEPALRDWLLAQPEAGREAWVRDMTLIRQQTRLDADKMVVKGSLRAIECGIPGLEFQSSLAADIPADCRAWFAGYLKALCAGVKSIGGERSRGLGRCIISAAGEPAGAAVPSAPPASLCAPERAEAAL